MDGDRGSPRVGQEDPSSRDRCFPFPQASDRASIHLLMESFLCKLQSEFPSTISTVYR